MDNGYFTFQPDQKFSSPLYQSVAGGICSSDYLPLTTQARKLAESAFHLLLDFPVSLFPLSLTLDSLADLTVCPNPDYQDQTRLVLACAFTSFMRCFRSFERVIET
jgi:hypothetical protein